MNSVVFLKSISNETKLRLVSLLLDNQLCVCELEEITNIKQANISKNLISLKDANIVSVKREKQRAFYFLSDTFKSQTHLLSHINELREIEQILKEDYKRFLLHEETKDNTVYVCNIFRNEELLW